jgi:hypothetical protein
MSNTPSPTRGQILASIEELTPDEKELALLIESKLQQLSSWNLRDAATKWSEDAHSMSIAMEHAVENKEWLRVAWQLIDVLNEADKIRHALRKCGITPEDKR